MPHPPIELSDQSRFRPEILSLSDSEIFLFDQRPEPENFQITKSEKFRRSNHCKCSFESFGQISDFWGGIFSGLIFRNFGPVMDPIFGSRAKLFQEFAGLFRELWQLSLVWKYQHLCQDGTILYKYLPPMLIINLI